MNCCHFAQFANKVLFSRMFCISVKKLKICDQSREIFFRFYTYLTGRFRCRLILQKCSLLARQSLAEGKTKFMIVFFFFLQRYMVLNPVSHPWNYFRISMIFTTFFRLQIDRRLQKMQPFFQMTCGYTLQTEPAKLSRSLFGPKLVEFPRMSMIFLNLLSRNWCILLLKCGCFARYSCRSSFESLKDFLTPKPVPDCTYMRLFLTYKAHDLRPGQVPRKFLAYLPGPLRCCWIFAEMRPYCKTTR